MLLEEIKKAYLKYIENLCASDYMPSRITMSKRTEEKLISEALGFVYVKVLDAPSKVYGMKIEHDNRLPDGLFVIGGLIGPGVNEDA